MGRNNDWENPLWGTGIGYRLQVTELGDMYEVRMSWSSMGNKNLSPTCLCPTGTVNAMRFLTAVSMEQPEMLEKVSRELWMRIWSRVRAGLWILQGRDRELAILTLPRAISRKRILLSYLSLWYFLLAKCSLLLRMKISRSPRAFCLWVSGLDHPATVTGNLRTKKGS